MAKRVLVGSKATERTHPRWEERTVDSFHGECHLGVGMFVWESFRSCVGMIGDDL